MVFTTEIVDERGFQQDRLAGKDFMISLIDVSRLLSL